MSRFVSRTSLFAFWLAVCSQAFGFAAGAAAGSPAETPIPVVAGHTLRLRVPAGSLPENGLYVNGIPGGSVLLGKIDASGVYTAPASAPSVAIEITAVDPVQGSPRAIAKIAVLDDPSIVEAHQRWMAGAMEAAAVYGCTHPTIQQEGTETVAEALKVYLLTADKSSCLILSPVSPDPDSHRYSYAWGGNVDGVDIYYISDVSRPRITLGSPMSDE